MITAPINSTFPLLISFARLLGLSKPLAPSLARATSDHPTALRTPAFAQGPALGSMPHIAVSTCSSVALSCSFVCGKQKNPRTSALLFPVNHACHMPHIVRHAGAPLPAAHRRPPALLRAALDPQAATRARRHAPRTARHQLVQSRSRSRWRPSPGEGPRRGWEGRGPTAGAAAVMGCMSSSAGLMVLGEAAGAGAGAGAPTTCSAASTRSRATVLTAWT